MIRDEILRLVARMARGAGAAVFTGNGYNARTLAALDDRPEFFYMVGSMGLCPTLAAGFAHRSRMPVIVVEGDGNALMGLSGFPVTACASSAAFVHIVLDNGLYETTGGQKTLAARVDFGLLALGAGYDRVYRPEDLLALEGALEGALPQAQRTFIVVRTDRQTSAPYPRVPYHPREIAERFRKVIAERI